MTLMQQKFINPLYSCRNKMSVCNSVRASTASFIIMKSVDVKTVVECGCLIFCNIMLIEFVSRHPKGHEQ